MQSVMRWVATQLCRVSRARQWLAELKAWSYGIEKEKA